MGNHQIPRAARRTERIEGRADDGAPVILSVYEHTRRGHSEPMFYVIQYRQLPGGLIDRDTRVTREFTGPRAAARLEAELAEARELLAASMRRNRP